MKAVNCWKCLYYTPMPEWDWRSPCGKDHKPRFYKSKGLRWEFANPEHWGHKRVCDDFQARPMRPHFIVAPGHATRPEMGAK